MVKRKAGGRVGRGREKKRGGRAEYTEKCKCDSKGRSGTRIGEDRRGRWVGSGRAR